MRVTRTLIVTLDVDEDIPDPEVIVDCETAKVVKVHNLEGERLPDRFASDFRRALAHMPYAAHPNVMKGNVVMGSYRDPLEAFEVIETLEALGEVLRQSVAENNAIRGAYEALYGDVSGMRRVLGLTQVAKSEHERTREGLRGL